MNEDEMIRKGAMRVLWTIILIVLVMLGLFAWSLVEIVQWITSK